MSLLLLLAPRSAITMVAAVGLETDSPPFPLSARASEIRAMAQNTRERSANGENRNREESEQNNEQNELFRG